MKACAQVVRLRKELAAARDHERLSLRATELRHSVAEAPIVAMADPLPAAFNATLGRVLPVTGMEGVALLLTIAVELISCSGLGGVAALYTTPASRGREGRLRSAPLRVQGGGPGRPTGSLPASQAQRPSPSSP
jgi:hypothetical protein